MSSGQCTIIKTCTLEACGPTVIFVYFVIPLHSIKEER